MGAIEEVIRHQLDVRPERLDPVPGRPTMKAVVTTGNGGLDRLVYRDVALPVPGPGEVLIHVLAAGVNNTEINTRLGWYSSSVTTGTGAAWEAEEHWAVQKADGGWSTPTPFPFIQGTDCCGRVVELGQGVDPDLIGKRILVRPNMRPDGFGSLRNVWMASEFDGAFAQFVKAPASEVFPVESTWTDVELGSIPCSYATAENMIHRAGVAAGDHVLVTGASGGVGSAAVQLARRRGARVTAIAARDKADAILALGAEHVLDRHDDVLAALGVESVDVVVDAVGGSQLGARIETLLTGGRYAIAGAISGPMVMLDARSLYLRDITLIGCTAWDEPVFPNLVGYIERGEIRPLVAEVFPLADIAAAQTEFLAKRHVGKLVLVPPPLEG